VTRFLDFSALRGFLRGIVLGLVGLGRYQKRAILACGDLLLLGLALWLVISLRLGELYLASTWQLRWLFCAAPVIGVATFFQRGLYRLVTRYIDGRGALRIANAVGLSAMFWALLVVLSGVQFAGSYTISQTVGVHVVPRSTFVFYPLLGTLLVLIPRFALGRLLKYADPEFSPWTRAKRKGVLIYGAGPTGLQLRDALHRTGQYVVVAFIDPTQTSWGQFIGNTRVHRPDRLASLIDALDVREVLLAMPKANRRERQTALKQLSALAIPVRTLPAIEDVAAGRVTVSDLRPVGVDDLLGREQVPPDPLLLARNIADKSVMVTGAGGSIGSELVRQILRHKPQRLVLFEASEAQLYEIESQAREVLQSQHAASANGADRSPAVVAVLGSVLDAALLRLTIEQHAVDTIYHAAAFKHVPIVEHNAVAGLRNNTFGTAIAAEVAASCGVERFVLISTDKAVRPTSIMGASKRLAEMQLQARAAQGAGRTVFTIVRFGNVLDSSGSVVRRFRKQIESGGPVTVTDRNVIRYFMSIPEAASLVIQSGAMANGGDVFVLDMGEPVKIDDLARSMIRLMGAEVRDGEHPDGDITIEYVGLRPGEKLHEELLIGSNTSKTEHPRILKSDEPHLAAAELATVFEALRTAMDSNDVAAIHQVLIQSVEGYHPDLRHLREGPWLDAALPGAHARQGRTPARGNVR
jgi:FlaA1/EpsC-like NDP-sugar epimerase